MINEYQLMAKRSEYRTNHILHLLLSVLSVGLWTPIWLLVTVSNANERSKIDKKLSRA